MLVSKELPCAAASGKNLIIDDGQPELVGQRAQPAQELGAIEQDTVRALDDLDENRANRVLAVGSACTNHIERFLLDCLKPFELVRVRGIGAPRRGAWQGIALLIARLRAITLHDGIHACGLTTAAAPATGKVQHAWRRRPWVFRG